MADPATSGGGGSGGRGAGSQATQTPAPAAQGVQPANTSPLFRIWNFLNQTRQENQQKLMENVVMPGVEGAIDRLSYLDVIPDTMRAGFALPRAISEEMQRMQGIVPGQAPSTAQGASGTPIREALQFSYQPNWNRLLDAAAMGANPAIAVGEQVAENLANQEAYEPVSSFGLVGDLAFDFATAALNPMNMLDDALMLGIARFGRAFRNDPIGLSTVQMAAQNPRGLAGFMDDLVPGLGGRETSDSRIYMLSTDRYDPSVPDMSDNFSGTGATIAIGPKGDHLYVHGLRNVNPDSPMDMLRPLHGTFDLADAHQVAIEAQAAAFGGVDVERISSIELLQDYIKHYGFELAPTSHPTRMNIVRFPMPLDDAARSAELAARDARAELIWGALNEGDFNRMLLPPGSQGQALVLDIVNGAPVVRRQDGMVYAMDNNFMAVARTTKAGEDLGDALSQIEATVYSNWKNEWHDMVQSYFDDTTGSYNWELLRSDLKSRPSARGSERLTRLIDTLVDSSRSIVDDAVASGLDPWARTSDEWFDPTVPRVSGYDPTVRLPDVPEGMGTPGPAIPAPTSAFTEGEIAPGIDSWWSAIGDRPGDAEHLRQHFARQTTTLSGGFKGWGKIDEIIDLPGVNDEHIRIPNDPNDQAKIQELAESMRNEGYLPGNSIMIWVEQDGVARIAEGNHRIRAAQLAGLDEVPIDVRYYGGSDADEAAWKPRALQEFLEDGTLDDASALTTAARELNDLAGQEVAADLGNLAAGGSGFPVELIDDFGASLGIGRQEAMRLLKTDDGANRLRAHLADQGMPPQVAEDIIDRARTVGTVRHTVEVDPESFLYTDELDEAIRAAREAHDDDISGLAQWLEDDIRGVDPRHLGEMATNRPEDFMAHVIGYFTEKGEQLSAAERNGLLSYYRALHGRLNTRVEDAVSNAIEQLSTGKGSLLLERPELGLDEVNMLIEEVGQSADPRAVDVLERLEEARTRLQAQANRPVADVVPVRHGPDPQGVMHADGTMSSIPLSPIPDFASVGASGMVVHPDDYNRLVLALTGSDSPGYIRPGAIYDSNGVMDVSVRQWLEAASALPNGRGRYADELLMGFAEEASGGAADVAAGIEALQWSIRSEQKMVNLAERMQGVVADVRGAASVPGSIGERDLNVMEAYGRNLEREAAGVIEEAEGRGLGFLEPMYDAKSKLDERVTELATELETSRLAQDALPTPRLETPGVGGLGDEATGLRVEPSRLAVDRPEFARSPELASGDSVATSISIGMDAPGAVDDLMSRINIELVRDASNPRIETFDFALGEMYDEYETLYRHYSQTLDPTTKQAMDLLEPQIEKLKDVTTRAHDMAVGLQDSIYDAASSGNPQWTVFAQLMADNGRNGTRRILGGTGEIDPVDLERILVALDGPRQILKAHLSPAPHASKVSVLEWVRKLDLDEEGILYLARTLGPDELEARLAADITSLAQVTPEQGQMAAHALVTQVFRWMSE